MLHFKEYIDRKGYLFIKEYEVDGCQLLCTKMEKTKESKPIISIKSPYPTISVSITDKDMCTIFTNKVFGPEEFDEFVKDLEHMIRVSNIIKENWDEITDFSPYWEE